MEFIVLNESALSNLQSRLNDYIDVFSRKRKRDKAKAFRYKLLALVLTLSATLALGIEWTSEVSPYAKQIAFIATALVGFFTGIDLYYNHKGLWVQFTITRNQLYRIRDDLDYYVEKVGVENMNEQELDEYHHRIQAVLDECNSWWVGERTKEIG